MTDLVKVDPPPLPKSSVELFFMLKNAVAHQLVIAADTVRTIDGVREGAVILARASRRVAVIADALDEARQMESKL